MALASCLALFQAGTDSVAAEQPIPSSMLDALAQQYREEELPLPPESARPIALPGIFPNRCYLGFRCKPAANRHELDTFLIGVETCVIPVPRYPMGKFLLRQIRSVALLPTELISVSSAGPSPFPTSPLLVLAIQCHLRGDDRLARQLLALDRQLAEKAESERNGSPAMVSGGGDWVDPKAGIAPASPPPGGSLRERLAATAWNHWMNLVATGGGDRRMTLSHLTDLLTAQPFLDAPARRAYLESLRLTLAPGKGPPGSVEALIDSLTEYGGLQPTAYLHGDGGEPNYEKLRMMGFAAAPALIEHLGDVRLTRAANRSDMGSIPTAPVCVCDVVNDLIESLAGEDLREDWVARQMGQPIDEKLVQEWWEKASAVGEEAYVTSHIYPTQKERLQFVSTTCLRITAARYPQHLRKIYERMLKERPDIDSRPLWEAIGEWEKSARHGK